MLETVFGEAYSNSYDSLYRDKDYSAESKLILDAFKRTGNDSSETVIDFGCGTGTHALLLAEHGIRVHGIDLSSSMLNTALNKIKQNTRIKCRPTFQQGDIANVYANGVFDAAIMMFAVLGYQIQNDRVLDTLKNVRRHLAEGGSFVADVWYGPAVLTHRPGDRVRQISDGDRTIIRTTETKLNITEHTADVTFGLLVLQDQRVITQSREVHKMRYFFPQELHLMYAIAGFKIDSITAFPTLDTPASDTSWNAFIVAKAI